MSAPNTSRNTNRPQTVPGGRSRPSMMPRKPDMTHLQKGSTVKPNNRRWRLCLPLIAISFATACSPALQVPPAQPLAPPQVNPPQVVTEPVQLPSWMQSQ